MACRTTTIAAAVAIGLSLAAAANAATVASVENICEPTPAGVNTVNVRLTSHDILEYAFQRVPNGQTLAFSAAGLATSRKFALAAGTYRLTYKNPSFPAVATYAPNVVVKPFKVANGACAFLRPSERPATLTGAAQ